MPLAPALRTTLAHLLTLALLLPGAPGLAAQAAPRVDHHQHILSERAAQLNPLLAPFDAADLVALLDDAGISQALVLSLAYQFANPNRPPVENEYDRVCEENDWTGRQAARYPERLRAFCSVNPLRPYALEEVARCARDPNLRLGLKLHFGNSDVDLDDPEHVERLGAVFRAANAHGMAVLAHIRPSVNLQRPYGAAQARVVLDGIIPMAPDVPVVIAHLAGAGGYADPVDDALGIFADAAARNDPRLARTYFDVSAVMRPGQTAEVSQRIAERIRQLGVGHVLYGTDGTVPGNTPKEAWLRMVGLPLTEAELETIRQNVAPFMRSDR